jgi:glycosyltransferase involved in cell wall biosynthesis
MLAIDANVVRERRDWRRTRSPRSLLRFLSYRTIERLAFRYFDAVVCVGPEDTAAFADLCPGIEYLTIPLGTDPPVSIVGRGGRDDATVLFVGNMAYGPNVLAATELITKVMPAIRQTHPDTRAVIVGPSVPKSLRVLESAHIDVTGFVDSVVPYYESATVLVSAMEAGAGVRT